MMRDMAFPQSSQAERDMSYNICEGQTEYHTNDLANIIYPIDPALGNDMIDPALRLDYPDGTREQTSVRIRVLAIMVGAG